MEAVLGAVLFCWIDEMVGIVESETQRKEGGQAGET